VDVNVVDQNLESRLEGGLRDAFIDLVTKVVNEGKNTPVIDPGIDEALQAFMAERKAAEPDSDV